MVDEMSTYTLELSNGQILSVYQGASQPKGSELCTRVGGPSDAVADVVNTLTCFTVSGTDPLCIIGITVPPTLTAGGFEIHDVTPGQAPLVSPGIEDLNAFVKDAAAVFPDISFNPGRTYRLIQSTPGNP